MICCHGFPIVSPSFTQRAYRPEEACCSSSACQHRTFHAHPLFFFSTRRGIGETVKLLNQTCRCPSLRTCSQRLGSILWLGWWLPRCQSWEVEAPGWSCYVLFHDHDPSGTLWHVARLVMQTLSKREKKDGCPWLPKVQHSLDNMLHNMINMEVIACYSLMHLSNGTAMNATMKRI